MPSKRYAKQDQDSFFGHHLSDNLVPEDHFFRKLNEIIEREHFSQSLIELYKDGEKYGRPPYDPALKRKLLFISSLYNPLLDGEEIEQE